VGALILLWVERSLGLMQERNRCGIPIRPLSEKTYGKRSNPKRMIGNEDEIRTHVMAANMSWYTQKRIDGIRGLPIDGCSKTPFRPKYSAGDVSDVWKRNKWSALKSPMNLLPVSLNAREKPQKNH